MYATRVVASLLLSTIALLTASACRRNSEALAAFKGGEVTRGELRMLFRIFQGDQAEKAATIKAQDDLLQKFAFLKIAAQSAKEEGLEKLPEYQKATAFLDLRAALQSFEIYVKLNSADHKFELMEVQHVLLRNQPVQAPAKAGSKSDAKSVGPPSTQTASRQVEAEALLKELNAAAGSEDKLHKLIREKTDLEMYRPVAGFEIPICTSCSMNPQRDITNRLKDVKEGEFIHVAGPGGHTLVRKIKSASVSVGDLENFFEKNFEKHARLAIKYLANVKDEKERKSIEQRVPLNEKQITARAKARADFLKRELNGLARNHSMKVRAAKKVSVYPEMTFNAKTQYTDATKLFSIDGKDRTYGDLRKALPQEFTIEERLQRAGLWLDHSILEQDPLFQKALKSNIYTFWSDVARKSSFVEAYFRKHLPAPKIEPAQVQAFYDANKNTVLKGRTLAAARQDIEGQLIQQQKQSAAKTIQEALVKKYELRVFRDKLEANKL